MVNESGYTTNCYGQNVTRHFVTTEMLQDKMLQVQKCYKTKCYWYNIATGHNVTDIKVLQDKMILVVCIVLQIP